MKTHSYALQRACLYAAWLVAAHSSFSQELSTGAPPQTLVPATIAQPLPSPQAVKPLKRWSLYWGWNRSTYSQSDIHFHGQDHDFTLKNVEAKDLQSDADLNGVFKYFLNPGQMTIPQTNLRLAYQWDEDTAFALNLDHMKYVVTQDQAVAMSGCYKNGSSAQICKEGNQVIADDWLNFEHTDGLNIISLELEKQRNVDWFGTRRAKVFGLVGAGVVLPKTNATMHMVGQVRNDEFHLAGWSVGAGAGVEINLWRDVFFRSAYKRGYVNLPDVLTSARGDKASHNFTYSELLVAIGLRF
jgi:hypothetical protein